MTDVRVQRTSCLKRWRHTHAEGRSDAGHDGSDDADGIAAALTPTRRMRVRLTGSARQEKNHGLMATVSPADARKSKAGQHPPRRAAPARGCPELDAMMQWCARMTGNRGATGRHATGGQDQQRRLAEKMTEHRQMCKAITVYTEARLHATLEGAPHARQLATEGGRGPPAEKHPVAGEMCSKTQMPRRLREARAAAAVKVKINRGRVGRSLRQECTDRDAKHACSAGVRPRVR